MQTTQNYGYNMVESTDTANIPVQISPNFNKIDNDLKTVSDAAITSAVDTFASNTHALVRDDADRNALFFVAPADYVAGDVFTLDGVNMNVTDAAGNALESNAFRVNSVVFGIVYGTRLTLNVVNPVAALEADNITYDNTDSGLTASDVQAAIDEIEAQITNLPAPSAGNTSYNNSVSGLIATNVQQAIDELKALIPPAHQYITTGLEIMNNRANIVDGGYYEDNGMVYVDIYLYTLTSINTGGFIVKGLPNALATNPSSPHAITPTYNGLAILHESSGNPTYIGAMVSLAAGTSIHFVTSYAKA